MSNRYIGGVVTETTNVDQSPWSGSWTEQAAMQSFGSVLRITNSLRFRASASAYLNRTLASSASATTFTYSFWYKPGLATVNAYALEGYSDDNNRDAITFNNNNLNVGILHGGSFAANLITTAVFRDPSAWYHFVVVYDSTQATASNRILLYVNGTQITAFSTASYPSQNLTTYLNSNVAHNIGRSGYSGGSVTAAYMDGYMAEVNFVDGQALPPTAFGAINKENGVWAPITYTGTYGLNGFRLTFNNTTSTTTLGYDSSGNGNNWTTNNISLTAGSTYDSMIDSPSKFPGASYGVGNYAVANPLDKGSDITASEGNLAISWGGVNGHSIRDSVAMSSGQWYCELTMGTSSVTMGLIAQNIAGVGSGSGWPGSSTFGVGGSYGYANSGNKYTNSVSSSYGASYTTGDVIGIAFDATAGTLTFYKNGSSQGTAFTGISGAYCFAIGYFGGSTGGTPAYANFGQRPFAYTPPTGYKTLCTQNLPNPTIFNGAQYMAATLYTGNNTTQSIVNAVNAVSFQPDLVWIKSRSNGTYWHELHDAVRGAGASLFSNSTNQEVTNNALTSFDSSGFTVSTQGGTQNGTNQSGVTYVGWQWKAGGTAVTNTAGSITSSVSANTTAGFSVVTYTGTGSAGTVGHGLGVAPSMVIVKARANATGWVVGHAYLNGGSSPWNYYLSLESTAAQGSTSLTWNNTAPTSSVFSLGSGSGTNPSSTMVAYCFAAIPGYSAFGSYTGNGSSDGPFVFCGFRPRYVLIKASSTTDNWLVHDTARDPYNTANYLLYPNLSDGGYTYDGTNTSYPFDILSNGFKIRSAFPNTNGVTYIFAAFAENPFQNALAR